MVVSDKETELFLENRQLKKKLEKVQSENQALKQAVDGLLALQSRTRYRVQPRKKLSAQTDKEFWANPPNTVGLSQEKCARAARYIAKVWNPSHYREEQILLSVLVLKTVAGVNHDSASKWLQNPDNARIIASVYESCGVAPTVSTHAFNAKRKGSSLALLVMDVAIGFQIQNDLQNDFTETVEPKQLTLPLFT